MAWSKLGQRSKAFGSYAGGFKIARPTGAAKGCLLVACVNLHEAPPAINSSNFTARPNEANANDRWAIFEKEDDGTQEFEVAWTGTKNAQGFVYALSPGEGKKAVYDASSIKAASGAKSIATTGITLAEAGELLMNLSVEGTGLAMVQPTGFAEIADEGTEETHGIHVGWKEQGAGGTGEQNFKEASANVTGFGVLIAWKATPTSKTVEFKASISSASEVKAKLTLTRLFVASISSASSVTAKLSLTRLFKAAISSASELKASLLRTRWFKASVASTSSIAAALEVKAKAATAFKPRRKPPLELDWEAETAEETRFRFPADTWKAANRFTGSSGSTQRGDGFATGGLVLNREIFRDYPDIGLMDTWRMVGRNGEIAYEGRMQSAPRTNDPQQQIQISLVGWMTYLKGRPISPLIIDRRLGGWGEPSTQRRADIYSKEAGRMEASPASSWQEVGAKGPGIIFTFSTFDGSYVEEGEAWVFAGGEDIAELRNDFDQISTVAEDTSWFTRGLLATDDVTVVDLGTNVHNVDATNQAVVAGGPGRKYAVLYTAYAGGYAGTGNNVHAFLYPRLIGTHGLTARGTSPEEGYYLSDILEYILSAYYPKIDWAGETNTFVVPQATWHDSPTTGYDAVQQLNNFALWETNVWEDRKFYFEPADLTKADWQLKTTDPGVMVNFQGDSIENFANGVPVVYTDFSGVQRTLWPPDHPELRDESEDNPANRHGEYLWTPPVTVPWPCLEAEALQFGRAYLGEYNRPKRPGSFTIEGGYIKDAAGHWQQYWKPRNSETLMVADHPAEVDVRLITATSWDPDSLNLTITVDAPSSLLDAVVARQELALQARNLA